MTKRTPKNAPTRAPISEEKTRRLMDAAQNEFWKDEAIALETKLSIAQLTSLLEIEGGRSAWVRDEGYGPLNQATALLMMLPQDLLELAQLKELESLDLIQITETHQGVQLYVTEKGAFFAYWWSAHLREILTSAPDTPSKSA
jgi:hypothetical protein